MGKPSSPSERKSTTEPREQVQTGRQVLVEGQDERARASQTVSATRPEPRPVRSPRQPGPPDRSDPGNPRQTGEGTRE